MHTIILGYDHINKFTTNPQLSSGGVKHGFLTLTVQVFVEGSRIFVVPNAKPGEPVSLESHNAAGTERNRRALASMPEIVGKLNAALRDHPFIREFFVLRSREQMLGGSSELRFILYEEDHNGLLNKIRVLESLGLLRDVTKRNAPMFRMTEDLVEMLSS